MHKSHGRLRLTLRPNYDAGAERWAQYMKRQILYLLILILPFFGMIMINEFARLNTKEPGYKKQRVTAINSAKRIIAFLIDLVVLSGLISSTQKRK